MHEIKRISTDMEVEDAKGILNKHSSKRSVVCHLVGSPCSLKTYLHHIL
jgi:hypothetical protein